MSESEKPCISKQKLIAYSIFAFFFQGIFTWILRGVATPLNDLPSIVTTLFPVYSFIGIAFFATKSMKMGNVYGRLFVWMVGSGFLGYLTVLTILS